MKTMKLKVSRAYCVELNEVIDIDTAIIRSAENNYCRFTFSGNLNDCSP
ncbi:MAG: hypothetical protein IKZ88_09470 [Neisseriaceae bacterium]|nr:hypothetical protein [Neisseriaceae bacterium]